jgi:hypothetical protein
MWEFGQNPSFRESRFTGGLSSQQKIPIFVNIHLNMTFKVYFLLLSVLLSLARTVRAQEAPLDVPYCALAQDPASFDGKMIRVRGTLSVGFEDFTLENAVWKFR